MGPTLYGGYRHRHRSDPLGDLWRLHQSNRQKRRWEKIFAGPFRCIHCPVHRWLWFSNRQCHPLGQPGAFQNPNALSSRRGSPLFCHLGLLG